MIKKNLIWMIGIMAISLVQALDEETIISCGGDEELIIGCIGDEQYSFIGYLFENEVFFYGALFGSAMCLLVLGRKKKKYYFEFMAGGLLLVIGIYTFLNGFPGVDSSYLESGRTGSWLGFASMIIIGMGLYFAIVPVFKHLGGQEDDGD